MRLPTINQQPMQRRAVRSEELIPSGPVVVLDVETTSLDPREARVIEIGAVLVEGHTVSSLLSEYCDPGCPIPAEVSALTGITDATVRGASCFDDLFPALIHLIGSMPVAAHNAPYDIAVLKAEAARLGRDFRPVAYDTLAIARSLWKGLPNYKLGTLCSAAGIPLNQAHRAIQDAEATAHLLIHFRDLLHG